MAILDTAKRLEQEGWFEKVRSGDQKAASYFVRLLAYTENPSANVNSWGCLTKSPGEIQVEGYAEDALALSNNPNNTNNVYDFIIGAGAPGAKLTTSLDPKPRRTNNHWEAPKPLSHEQMEYLKAPKFELKQTVGVSMFWLLRAVKENWSNLRANLQAAKDLGATHVRAFAIVGGADISPDPWVDAGSFYGPSWQSDVRKATDFAFDNYGLKVQWTIFGGIAQANHYGAERIVREWAQAVTPVLHKVHCVDLVNEYESNGWGQLVGTMRELCRLLKSLLPPGFLIGMSSPTGTHAAWTPEQVYREVDAMYDGDSGCNYIPIHWGRESDDQLYWKSGVSVGSQLPVASNEPMGPDASVRPVSDPNKLAQHLRESRAAGEPYYQWHSAVGVWGGRIASSFASSHPEGTQQLFTEYPQWNEYVRQFRAILGDQPIEPPVVPPVEVDMIAVEEFMSEMVALHNFYRSDAGLQRPQGIGAFDADALGQWLYNTYVRQREGGASPEQARAAYESAIRQSDEWKVKHGVA